MCEGSTNPRTEDARTLPGLSVAQPGVASAACVTAGTVTAQIQATERFVTDTVTSLGARARPIPSAAHCSNFPIPSPRGERWIPSGSSGDAWPAEVLRTTSLTERCGPATGVDPMKRSRRLTKAQRECRYRRRYQLEFDGLCASLRPCIHARVDDRVGVSQDRPTVFPSIPRQPDFAVRTRA